MSTEKNSTTGKVVEIFGPPLEFPTEMEEAQNDFCVLKGVISPGVFIPLHSHLVNALRSGSVPYFTPWEIQTGEHCPNCMQTL